MLAKKQADPRRRHGTLPGFKGLGEQSLYQGLANGANGVEPFIDGSGATMPRIPSSMRRHYERARTNVADAVHPTGNQLAP
jgi:hypothetical protein